MISAATRSTPKRTVRYFCLQRFINFSSRQRSISGFTHEPYAARSRIGRIVPCVVDECHEITSSPHGTDRSSNTALEPYALVEVRSRSFDCVPNVADGLDSGGLPVRVIVGVQTRTSLRIVVCALWNRQLSSSLMAATQWDRRQYFSRKWLRMKPRDAARRMFDDDATSRHGVFFGGDSELTYIRLFEFKILFSSAYRTISTRVRRFSFSRLRSVVCPGG